MGGVCRSVLVRAVGVRGQGKPAVNICIELHPGTTVYNVETFEKFIGLGENLYANLDPSHFFWMQMDADRIVERSCRVSATFTPRM